MAYTQKNVEKTVEGGSTLTVSAGVAGGAGTGYKFSNDGQTRMNIRNTGAGTPNVVILPGGTLDGVTLAVSHLQTIAMSANSEKSAGPWRKDIYDQQGTTDPGMVYVYFTGSNETDIEIELFN